MKRGGQRKEIRLDYKRKSRTPSKKNETVVYKYCRIQDNNLFNNWNDFFFLGGSSGGSNRNEEVQDLQVEVEKCHEKMEIQDTKLRQAAEFISYQEEQINSLTSEIEELQVNGGGNRWETMKILSKS